MRHVCAKSWFALCVVTSMVGSPAGCSSGPRVPEGAKLVWFGSSAFSMPKDDLPSGTFYLTEDGSGRTVSAAYRVARQPLHFDGLRQGRKYRLYFVEGQLTSPASTQPTGG